MAGSLINKIALLSAASYGVNILEQDVPSGVQGVGSDVVAMVAELPWGPDDVNTDVVSTGELFDTYCPTVFTPDNTVADVYPALRAVINKTFPAGLKIRRVAATSAAKAAHTFADVTPVPSLDVTARYKGAIGNRIKVEIQAGSSGTKRTAIVTIGTSYSATYVDLVNNTTVTDPGDPYVVFAAHTGMAAPPAVAAATSLTSGSDGTADADDYSDALVAFQSDSVVYGAIFVAECPAALIDDVNTALLAHAAAQPIGMVVLCTVNDQARAAAITYVADYADTEGRIVYAWPRVSTVDTFDPDRELVEVDGNAFMASLIVQTDPEVSPGGPAPNNIEALAGIAAVESEQTKAGYNAATAAGISAFFMHTSGCIVRNAVTTCRTAGKTKIFRRRMTDFVTRSIAAFLEPYVERPLDLKLTPPTLGPITQQEYGAMRAFLEDLADPKNPRIAGFILDVFGGMTSTLLAAGTWVIRLTVQLFSSQDVIVLQATVSQGAVVVVAQ